MPFIDFPDVPPYPGVPALPSLNFGVQAEVSTPFGTVSVSAGFSLGGGALLLQDDPGLGGTLAETEWGVFAEDGSPLATFDAFVDFEYDKEYRLADYPLSGGKFETYNKVETPYMQRVAFAQGGGLSTKSGFLSDLETAAGDYNLYTVVTPEITYVNANLSRLNYRRRASEGATLLVVEITMIQVRIGTAPAFSSTASAQGSNQQAAGAVQAQDPTMSQSSAAAGGAT